MSHTDHIKSDFLVPYKSKSSFSEKFSLSLGSAVWPLELTFMFDNVILSVHCESMGEMNSDYSPFIVGIKLSLRLAPCHYFHGHGGFSCPHLAITRPSQGHQAVIIVGQENLPGQDATDCSEGQF